MSELEPFLIYGGWRRWSPMPGQEHPKGEGCYELVCLPGGLVGIGETLADALESLAELVRWSLEEEPDWLERARSRGLDAERLAIVSEWWPERIQGPPR